MIIRKRNWNEYDDLLSLIRKMNLDVNITLFSAIKFKEFFITNSVNYGWTGIVKVIDSSSTLSLAIKHKRLPYINSNLIRDYFNGTESEKLKALREINSQK